MSYAAEDVAVAEQVADKLRALGAAIWMAPASILPGQSYNEAIVAGVRSSDMLVVLVSNAANASRHVVREVGLADDQGKRIVPLRIEAVDPSDGLAFYLSQAHWVELRAEAPADLERVVSLLDGAQGAPMASPMAPPAKLQAHVAVASLRIHRSAALNSRLSSVQILLDGERVGEVGNDQTLEFDVEPGRHELIAKILHVRSNPCSVRVEPGQVASLRLDLPGPLDFGRGIAGAFGRSSFFRWTTL